MRGWLAVLALATLTLLIGLKLRWKRSEDDEDMPEDEEVQYGDPAEHDAAVRQLFFLVLAAVAVPIATLVLQQRQLLYRPEVSGRPRVASGVRSSPSAWGLQYESYFIRSRDGTKVHAWLLGLQKQGERRRPAILFFHSNAGDISQRLDFFKRCCKNLDVVVLAMEYRGYGRSENGGRLRRINEQRRFVGAVGRVLAARVTLRSFARNPRIGFSMAGSWLLAPLLLAQALASPDVTCLSSIKVIDNFLSDAEAQAVITDLEAKKPQRSGFERVSQEAPVLAQRLKSELRSIEQEAQLSSAVEVLEPVGEPVGVKLIHEVAGHAAPEKRLRETMTGKEAAQLEASKSSVPVSRKSGDVHEHADHVTHWVNGKVPGTAAVAYLESAPDGGSLGKLIFKDISDDQKVVKEVDAIAKRFISWDNSKCLHSFKARYHGTRRLLGPLALTSYGDMVKVGPITQPTTTTTEAPEATTTEEPEAPKSYYGRWKKSWWSWKKGYSGYSQSAPSGSRLVQDGSSDAVHFMQIDKNGSQKEL
ncbi:WAV2 [Symbiodinium sp. CCMP2592]|nr:WAV2 [Symbiodinium sp. CCMP2592]